MFVQNKEYRAAGCCFQNLRKAEPSQLRLLDSHVEKQKKSKVYEAVDELEKKYGCGVVGLASSMKSKSGNENIKRLKFPTLGHVK